MRSGPGSRIDGSRSARETLFRSSLIGPQVPTSSSATSARLGTRSEPRRGRSKEQAARGQGIRIRAGLHAGEVFEVGDRLLGICVNTASRVADRAGANEVLTTELVRGLVEGSGFDFEDAGEHELKGIGLRRLLRLT